MGGGLHLDIGYNRRCGAFQVHDHRRLIGIIRSNGEACGEGIRGTRGKVNHHSAAFSRCEGGCVGVEGIGAFMHIQGEVGGIG